MGIQPMIYCALLGCLISLLIVPLVLLPGLLGSMTMPRGTDPMDSLPREHGKAWSSLGGVALATSFLAVTTLIYFLYPSIWDEGNHTHLAIVWTGLAMFFLGLWDDYRPLGKVRRILLQSAIAAGAYAQGVQLDTFPGFSARSSVDLGPWGALVTVAWLVGLTNAIGLIPRWKGRPGRVSLAVTLLALLLILAGSGFKAQFPAMCGIGIAGGVIGCMLFSFPPHRINLGGAGTGFLGFVLGSLMTLNSTSDETLAAGLFIMTLLLPGLGLAVLVCSRPKGLPPLQLDPAAVSRRFLPANNSRTRSPV